MRKYNHYKNELRLNVYNKNYYTNLDVAKIQEWLWINNQILFFSDRDFSYNQIYDDVTIQNVKDFQKNQNINDTGIVDEITFKRFVSHLKNSFDIGDIEYSDFRDLICKIALIHYNNFSTEININSNNENKGPWVRSYCSGAQGLKWCLGFVNTIFDIACDIDHRDLEDYLVDDLDCDTAVQFAKNKGCFMKFSNIDINRIKPGDIFFTYSTLPLSYWVHTGIITKIFDNGTFESIEGNASTEDGVGIRVEKKIRNFNEIKYFKNEDGINFIKYDEFYLLNL